VLVAIVGVFPVNLIFLGVSRCWRRVSLPEPEGEDEDVERERAVVMTTLPDDQDLLVLRNLTKIYGTRCSAQHRLAVNQLCLRMEKGEVGVVLDGKGVALMRGGHGFNSGVDTAECR